MKMHFLIPVFVFGLFSNCNNETSQAEKISSENTDSVKTKTTPITEENYSHQVEIDSFRYLYSQQKERITKIEKEIAQEILFKSRVDKNKKNKQFLKQNLDRQKQLLSEIILKIDSLKALQ